MKVYEKLLEGYYGGTDETDHLVKWIASPSEEAATKYCSSHGWVGEPLTLIDVEPEREAGVDVIVDENGEEIPH